MTDDHSTISGLGVNKPGGLGERVSSRIGSADGESDGVSFEEILRNSIRDVNELQTDAAAAIKNSAVGESQSVAEVMTAVEKADLAFQTLMQVRNKLVDAYEELMRMRF